MFESRKEQGTHARIAGRGVGATLRAAREAGGETIFDAAKALRIRAEYLYALEEEDFQNLPGWAYALSYVRTYAEYLGLEATPIVKRVRERYEFRQHMLFAEAAKATERPRRRRIARLVAAASVAIGIGWYLASFGADLTGIFDPIPRHFKALIDRSFFTVAEGEDPAALAPPSSTAAVGRSEQEEAGSVPSPNKAVPIADGPGTRFGALRDESEDAQPLVIGNRPRAAAEQVAATGGSLVLRARGPVWLTIEDGAGELVLARQLRKGDLYRLPPDPGIAVSADDAGAVEYYVDGRLVGLLGPSRRGVSRVPVSRLTQGLAGG